MSFFSTADGYQHHYKEYAAASSQTIMILLHGIFENHRYLAPLAENLAEQNLATVYTPDLRGYGDHATQKGDIDYIGQHEDDLEAFVQFVKEIYPQSTIILAGHSAGGGTLLRCCEHSCSKHIDCFLLLAPFIHHSAPTIPKNNEKGNGKALLGRLVSLFILNGWKITKWNHSIVYQNQKPKEERHGSETLNLSYRLFVSRYPSDYKKVISNLSKPTLLLVGSEDEEFVADAYYPLFQTNSHVNVSVVEDADHDGILSDKKAFSQIEQWIKNNN